MLELDSITAGYGETTVLHNLSLTLEKGKVAALLGPNGAGKTTLLRAATGHVPITSGTLRLNGEDVTGLRPHQFVSRGVCHISEGRAVFPSLTVHDNLVAFAKRGTNEKDMIAKAADAFPILGKRLKQRAGTMSGGEQQMLALVRAWIQDPVVIIVDEPSLGLAPKIVDAVYDFLQRLSSEGCSMIVVEQYVNMAIRLADTVHVVVHGEVVHSAAADAVDRDSLTEFYVGGGRRDVSANGAG